MKKTLLLFAVLLQTVLVMAQNPAKRIFLTQGPETRLQEQQQRNIREQAQKLSRPWIIVGDQEDVFRKDREPLSKGHIAAPEKISTFAK